jgi:Na+/melibiose symporter-like transporter
MIITRQKNVPWLWVASAHLPWAAMLFASAANTIVFTLEIRKFTANPAAIATLMTFTGFLTIFTGPVINWLSDRVWTRWGRRKIFYVPAVVAQATLILFVPFAPNLGWLAFIYFLQFMALSFKAPNESLNQEIIPNHQRGRAAVFNKIYVQFGLMAYNLALIGRFDDILPGTPLRRFFGSISGEVLIFVVFSLALLSVVLLVSLGIKEIRPNRRPDMRAELGGKITPWRIGKKLFLDVFSAEWWPLYLLALSQAMYGIKLGGMVALMYTDQWGYSTQVLGYTQGIGQLASIFIVMLVFPLADKFDKLKFYLVCVWLGMIGKLIWYAYVMLLVPDNRPSVLEILLVGEGINVLGQLAGIISYPLVYEFIPLNKLGTASAGLGLFRGAMGMVLGPLMGVWLLYYSNIFMPGAGSEIVAVFSKPVTEQHVETLAKDWEKETGQKIWVNLHKPYGLRADDGRPWSIRIRDKEAEKLQAEIEDHGSLLTDLQREIDSARIRGEAAPADKLARKEELNAALAKLRADQSARAAEFREFLRGALAGQLTDLEAGVASVTLADGRVAFVGETAFPVEPKRLAGFAEQLGLKLNWPDADLRFEVDPARPARVLVSGRPPAEIAAFEPDDAELAARVRALTAVAPEPELAYRAAYRLVSAASDVLAGDRNTLLRPFPDAHYRPHKVDYFSSYLLMAGTDIIAILIAMYLIRAERTGKIQRRGKIEDDAAHGHAPAAPAPAKS